VPYQVRQTLLVGAALVILPLPSVVRAPTLLAPLPILVLLPLFALGLAGLVVPAVFFWLWSSQLFRGESQVPRRSAVLLGVLTALTVPYFIVSWGFGVQYQGTRHAVVMAAANTIFLAALWWLLHRSRTRPSFTASLRFHAALFAWLSWCAFPNLGEL